MSSSGQPTDPADSQPLPDIPDGQPMCNSQFTEDIADFMNSFQAGAGLKATSSTPDLATSIGKAFARGVKSVETQLGQELKQALVNMQKQMSDTMDARMESLRLKQEEFLRQQQEAQIPPQNRRRQEGLRGEEPGSDSNASQQGDIPMEERYRIPLDDLHTSVVSADMALVNQGICGMLEKYCPIHWSWDDLNNSSKCRLLYRVKGAFKNGRSLSDDYLKEKIWGTLKNMRSYICRKIQIPLMETWNGDSGTVKKLHFDYSISKLQLETHLLEERSVCVFLKVRELTKLILALPKDAPTEARQPLQLKLDHWAAVYDREGPVPSRRLQAVLRAEKIKEKEQMKEREKSRYSQGGWSTFSSTFYKIFKRMPTAEEDQYAKSNGTAKLHEKLLKEIEEERRVQQEAGHAAPRTNAAAGEEKGADLEDVQDVQNSSDNDGGQSHENVAKESSELEESAELGDSAESEESTESEDSAKKSPAPRNLHKNGKRKPAKDVKSPTPCPAKKKKSAAPKRTPTKGRMKANVSRKKIATPTQRKPTRVANAGSPAARGKRFKVDEARTKQKEDYVSRQMNLSQAINGDIEDQDFYMGEVPSPIPLQSRAPSKPSTKKTSKGKRKL